MIRFEGSDNTLWFWPCPVLIEANLIGRRGKQIATIVIEGDVINNEACVGDIDELALLVKAINPADVLILPCSSQVSSFVRENNFLHFRIDRTLELHGDFLITDVIDFNSASFEADCKDETIGMELNLRDGSLFLELSK